MQISLRLAERLGAQLASHLEARSIWSVLPLMILVLTSVGMTVEWAAAESPTSLYSVSAPVPLNAADCRLAAQILDIRVENVNGRVWAAVEGQFLIENTNRMTPQTITVTFPSSLPGGFVFGPEHLSNFAVRADGVERELVALHLAPSIESSPVVTQAYALTFDLDAGDVLDIGVSYRQDLGDSDTIIFRFANSLGSRWSGALGSSLMTIELPEPSHREQILSVKPENVIFDGRKVTWYGSDFEPTDDIEFSFVNPSLWKNIEQHRLAAMERLNSPEAHYQLALLYRQLLSAQLAARNSAEFELLMLAELETARQLVGDRPDPLRCAIQNELANFYIDRLVDFDGSLSVSSASQALYELEQALQACPENEIHFDWFSTLEDLYLYLARAARTNGFYERALLYLNQLDDLRNQHENITTSFQADLSQERRLCYLAWVDQLLADGDVERALSLAGESGMIDMLAVDSSLTPRFSSIQASISTRSTERQIRLAFTPSSLLPDSGPVVNDLRQAMQTGAGIENKLTAGEDGLELLLNISFVSGEDLLQKQFDVVRALPDWVELSFVKDILSPQKIEMVLSESWWETHEFYREIVDAYPTEAKYVQKQKACEAELIQSPADSFVGVPEENEVVMASRIKNKLIQLCRDDWKRLLQDNRVVFSTEWSPQIGEPIKRTWLVLVGQVREMELESWSYNPHSMAARIGSYLLGALIVWVILFIAIRLIVR